MFVSTVKAGVGDQAGDLAQSLGLSRQCLQHRFDLFLVVGHLCQPFGDNQH